MVTSKHQVSRRHKSEEKGGKNCHGGESSGCQSGDDFSLERGIKKCVWGVQFVFRCFMRERELGDWAKVEARSVLLLSNHPSVEYIFDLFTKGTLTEYKHDYIDSFNMFEMIRNKDYRYLDGRTKFGLLVVWQFHWSRAFGSFLMGSCTTDLFLIGFPLQNI